MQTNPYVYCTLFDSNYLDKGILTIKSLLKTSSKAELYVLAMDQRCYECLVSLAFERVTVIHLQDFEDDELLKAKSNRSRGEYCWTCTASLIWYVLTKKQELYCTYIDADMYFYANPDRLIDEMIKTGKTVQIMKHRIRNGLYGRNLIKYSGIFCVEFNTFKNEKNSLDVLKTWKYQTLNECRSTSNGKSFGDQMYLNEWPKKYKCVYVNRNIGAGIAPWNINRYSLKKMHNRRVIRYDCVRSVVPVFYHFHGINYINNEAVDIGASVFKWHTDKAVIDYFYINYLNKITEVKRYIYSKFGFMPSYSRVDVTGKLDRCCVENKKFVVRIIERIREGYLKELPLNVEKSIKVRINKLSDIYYIK